MNTLTSTTVKRLYLSIVERDDESSRPVISNLYALSKNESAKYPIYERKLKSWLQTDAEAFSLLEDAYESFLTTVNTVESKLSSNNPVPSVREELIRINSAFLSFLSISRLYVDHTASKIGSKNLNELKLHKVAASKEFDEHFAYRFFCQLRNYAQHRGLPLTGLNATGEIDLTTNKAKYTFELFFIKSELLEYKKIWSQLVYPDLLRSPERIPVLPLSEEYMECMRRIRQSSVRAFLPLIQKELAFIGEIIKKGQGQVPLYMADLKLVGMQDNEPIVDAHFTEVPVALVELANQFLKDKR